MNAPGATTNLELREPVEVLVRRARAGDRAAESELCRRFVPAIRSFAARRLVSRDAVDEFAQDVLLTFLHALRSGAIEHEERTAGFVLGICRNWARDQARRKERRELLWDTFAPTLAETAVPELDAPNFRVLHLEDCLSQLSQRARDVLCLGFGESRSHEEIARKLDLTPENARVLRHRSLVALRECMGKTMSWEAA